MSNFILKAVVQTVSPVNIVNPGDEKGKSGVQTAFVGDQTHACIPGSSIRGALRRSAVEVVRAAIKQQTGEGRPWDLRDHLWNVIGGVKKDNTDAGNEFSKLSGFSPFALVQNVRSRNPLMSLFGTFDPTPIEGHLITGNIVSNEPLYRTINDRMCMMADIRGGSRSDDLVRSPEIAETLKPGALDEYEDIKSGAKKASEMAASIKLLKQKAVKLRKSDAQDAEIQSVYDEVNVIEEKRRALIAEEADSSVQIQQMVPERRFIPQGTKMTQRGRLFNANDIEIGLLLKTFSQFADKPFVGGLRSIGGGELRMRYEFRELPSREVVGEVEMSLDDGFVVIRGGDWVAEKLQAWDDFVSSGALKTQYPSMDEVRLAA